MNSDKKLFIVAVLVVTGLLFVITSVPFGQPEFGMRLGPVIPQPSVLIGFGFIFLAVLAEVLIPEQRGGVRKVGPGAGITQELKKKLSGKL